MDGKIFIEKDWFINYNIKTIDDPNNPTLKMFLLSDVAKLIGDKNYRRYKTKHVKNIEIAEKGEKYVCNMLTEFGLYDYLLKVKVSTTEVFRNFIITLIMNNKKNIHIFDAKFQKDYVLKNLIHVELITTRCEILGIDIWTLDLSHIAFLDKKIYENMPVCDIDKLIIDYCPPKSRFINEQ